MIRLGCHVVALTLAAASSAMAQGTTAVPAAMLAAPAPPALRAHVTVNSDLVRIGDLVENAGAVADTPIFRAPDLGTTGAVSVGRVIEALRPHHLLEIDTGGLTEVTVSRASRTIPVEEITARVAQALAGQYGFGEARNISLSFDRPVMALQVEPGAAGALQVTAFRFDPRTTRFDITLDLPASTTLHRQPVRFTGTAIETVEALTVDHPVERGQVLQVSDLTVIRRPKTQAELLTDAKAAAGLSARHQLRPGLPLTATDLMKPEVVQRNDTVTLVYQAPGLTLTLRGEAQDAGAIGDTIGVINSQTKRVVHGVITAAGLVNIGAAGTQVLANASPPVAAIEPAQQRP